MSRSAVVAVVTGIALLVGYGVVANMYRHGLDGRQWWVIAGTLALGAYGVLLAATCVRRIVDPSLPVPWTALLLDVAFSIMRSVERENRRERDGRAPFSDDDSHQTTSDPSEGPMGVG